MSSFLNMDFVIVALTSLAAAGTFVALIIPLMNRDERKERVRSVIEKKRKSLFEQTREQSQKPGKADEKSLSASESVAAAFKMQKLMGDMGAKVRDQMYQAGYRSPNAPVKYMMARFGIAVFLVLFCLLIIVKKGEDISDKVAAMMILGGAFIGYMLPKVLLKNQIIKRMAEINLAFPDALDMMLICVQGGIGLEQTVDRIAEEISEHSPVLAEELGILSAEMAMLNDRRGALQDFARRVGSGAAKSFATALIQAEQYGTSVSQALRVMSDELRDQRMAEAERKAASLPPKLTVPMIMFFLPVLFVIILVPTVMQAMENLSK
jgi:tight adherence protein C